MERVRRRLVSSGELLEVEFNGRLELFQIQVRPRFPTQARSGQAEPIGEALPGQSASTLERLDGLFWIVVAE